MTDGGRRALNLGEPSSAGLVVHHGAHPGSTGYHLAEAVERLQVGRGEPRPHRTHLRLRTLDASSYLWIESGKTSLPLDAHLAPFATAGYLIDAHLHPELSRLQAQLFDVVFVAQRDLVQKVAANHPRAVWVPLAAPGSFLEIPRSQRHDAAFVGNVVPGSRREAVLLAVESEVALNDWRRRYLPAEMGSLYASSGVVVNPPANGDLNMRFFEALACGALVVTAPIGNGQNELAVEGRDFVVADFDEPRAVASAVAAAVERSRSRPSEAAARRKLVSDAHTYGHRIQTMVTTLRGAAASAPVREMSDRERGGLLLDLANAYEDAGLLRHAVTTARGRVAPLGVVRAAARTARRAAIEGLDGRVPDVGCALRRIRMR